jgi:hypothetical protein
MDLTGADLMNGGMEFPKLKFESESEECVKKVYRPLRFDTFAMIRPLSFNRDLLVLKPSAELVFYLDDKDYNIGAGLEVQSHLLRNMIFLSFGTKLTENIWKHNLAFALNLRAFELDLGVALRSQSKEKSFQASGTEVNVGMRFGW